MSYSMNRYWIPQWDIHKRVITQQLPFYLGPQATVRPYTLEGEDGFLISTPGACLTDEQIDDICQKSKELWDKQASARAQQNPAVTLKRPLHQPVVVSKAGDSSRKSGHRHSPRR
ncbi:hypothetical protein NLU13_7472 [Sarocladium strictum]|uniref:Uncharacterized protein n=1 Tax=Sarocladium strictum TaxID=5046 RepID=A0AA39L5U9_SARSR|nr:hypothetical protein NLU13_7472 [Sarocladium strictum]